VLHPSRLRAAIYLWSSSARMVPERIRVADVGLQHVHALMPAHISHLEYRRAAAGRAGQEAGPQGVGAEVGRLEPEARGMGLHQSHTLLSVSRCTPGRPPFATGRNNGPSAMPAACSHTLTGHAVTPRAMAIVTPWPSWSACEERFQQGCEAQFCGVKQRWVDARA
jgi:hypothetical protein